MPLNMIVTFVLICFQEIKDISQWSTSILEGGHFWRGLELWIMVVVVESFLF